MYVTLDQARAFDALARHGTFVKAAGALHKQHSAVLYAVKQLEMQTGLTLLDRTSYRTRLTAAGDAVWQHCQRLLVDEQRLYDACQTLQSGWEPSLSVVFDAIYPVAELLGVIKGLRQARAPTRVQVTADSLDGVERRFDRDNADLMISVLPLARTDLVTHRLTTLKAMLVAAKRHPLAKHRPPLTPDVLAEHVLLTVQGSDPRLQLPTGRLDHQSLVRLPDFHAKKAAVLEGLGFGWLPQWLVADELALGRLVPLTLPSGSAHRFEPTLYARPSLGRAGQEVVRHLVGPRSRTSKK